MNRDNIFLKVFSAIIICLSIWTWSWAEDYPHNIDKSVVCASCHATHLSGVTNASSYGILPIDFAGTLCMSCHKTTGSASAKPFSAIMQAISSKGTSHRWDRPMPATDNPANRFGLRSALSISTAPSVSLKYPPMRYLLINESNIPTCNVCHDVHAEQVTPWNPFAVYGTATSGTALTLTDTTKSWTTNQFVGNWLRIMVTNGSASRIVANTTSSIIVTSAFSAAVNAGDSYAVSQGMNFLRNYNNTSQICEDCHYYRSAASGLTNVRVWVSTGVPLSHPVAVSMSGAGDPAQYNAVPLEPQTASWSTQAGSRFELNGAGDTNVTNNIEVDASGQIRCLSCHGVHYTDSNTATVDGPLTMGAGDGNLLRRSRADLCHGCHKTDSNAPSDPNSIKSHNSTLTSSAYWSGNWGVAGGKYGQIQCVTCHTGHLTDNIFLVISSVKAPNAPTDSFPGRTVDFRYLSSSAGSSAYTMGDDSLGTTSRTTSTRICEVCHSQTLDHRYNASGQTVFNHENGSNCVACHSHKNGFKSAACDSCHGAPPGSGVDNNETARFAQSHTTHYDYATAGVAAGYGDASTASTQTAYVFRCGRCHSTNAGDHGPGETNGVTDVKLNARTGVVVPQEFYTFGAAVVFNTPPPGTISFQDTDGRCYNIYCHGNFGQSGVKTNVPVWGSSATAACGTCHGATAASPPSGGTHATHVSTIPYRFTCDLCHYGTTTDGITLNKFLHVNERSDVQFSADTRASTGLYNGLATFSRFPVTSTAYYACTNTYCHSDGQKSSAFNAPNRTAQWGTTFDCTGCHGGPSGSAYVMTNASHLRHVVDQAPVNGAAFPCEKCHAVTVQGTSTLNGPMATFHVNRQVNVNFLSTLNVSGLATYTGSLTPGDAYGRCTNVYCHTDGNVYNNTPGAAALMPTWGSAWTTLQRCAGCHGDGVSNNWPTYASGNPGTTLANSHMSHAPALGGNASCQFCHISTTQDGSSIVSGGGLHLNKAEDVVFMATTIGGSYTQASKTCGGTHCHRSGAAPWGSNVATVHQCIKCHGVPGITTTAYVASTAYFAAPGYLATGTNVDGTVGAINNKVATDTKVGAHDVHLRALNTMSLQLDCTDCHAIPPSPLSSNGHMFNSVAQFSWSTLATKGNTLSPIYSSGNQKCYNVYCHGASLPSGNMNGLYTNPQWNTAYFAGGLVNTLSGYCSACHLSPPPTSSHNSTMAVRVCQSCHGHWSTNGYWLTPSFHVDGQLQGGSCVGCHNSPVTITKGSLIGSIRRAVTPEFYSTWSHVRSSRTNPTDPSTAQVDNYTCTVCHMEGDPATGGPVGTWHKDGYIQLRDPDTGTLIQYVTFVGWTSAGTSAGFYTNTGTAVTTMAKFRRDLTSVTLEPEAVAVQINLCLKCHDYNGAMSTLAQVPQSVIPMRTNMRPFGYWVTGISTVGNNNGAGNLVNVYDHFITTNASYHPILGKANNSFAAGVKMKPPWNGLTKPWTSGAVGTTTAWGYLITCWDCHSDYGAQTAQDSTPTAHGSPWTLRSDIRPAHLVSTITANAWLGTTGFSANPTTNAGNLCLVCHGTQYGITGNAHGSGSAFQSGGSSMNANTTMRNCHYCHGVGIGVSSISILGTNTIFAASVRPLRAEDAHGFNDRFANVAGSTWNTGASNWRPYAFIRNVLTVWRPRAATGAPAGTTGYCTGIAGRTCDDNMSDRTYSPGGAY